jgi:hypothetical protein
MLIAQFTAPYYLVDPDPWELNKTIQLRHKNKGKIDIERIKA